MPLNETVKFLGASVVNFNCTMGWGESSSTLNVTLVEDIKNGDSFTEVVQIGTELNSLGNSVPITTSIIGRSFIFDFHGWQFGGIVQSWTRNQSSGGETIQVVMIDPRDVLSNTVLILDNYINPVNRVPNIFNIYGYVETKYGVGELGKTQNGVPWLNVLRGLSELMNGASPPYGQYIQMNGMNYILNLDDLPQLPETYRISQDELTVMDLISEICEVASHDFFFRLTDILIDTSVNPWKYVGVIRLHTVNRNYEPTLGVIQSYVEGIEGASVKKIGYEFKQETTSRFLVGGKVSQIFAVENVFDGYYDRRAISASPGWEEFASDPKRHFIVSERVNNNPPARRRILRMSRPEELQTIWPYWGEDSNGNLILGRGIGDDHYFTVEVPPSIGNAKHSNWDIKTYTMTVGELKAALLSQEEWEFYLADRDKNYYIKDHFGPYVSFQVDPLTNTYILDDNGEKKHYYHSLEVNPHFGKATIMGISPVWKDGLEYYLHGKSYDEMKKLPFSMFLNLAREETRREIEPDKMYEFVRSYAERYLGKMWMIRLPYVITVDEYVDNTSSGPVDKYRVIITNTETGSQSILADDFATLIFGDRTFDIMESYRDNDTGEIVTVYEPNDAGYLEESFMSAAVSTCHLPSLYKNLMTQDGRIYAYARFNGKLGVGNTSENVLYNTCEDSNGEKVKYTFIKMSVNNNIGFLNRENLIGPRVIVSFPDYVREQIEDDKDVKDSNQTGQYVSAFKEMLTSVFLSEHPDEIQQEASALGITPAELVQQIVNNIFSSVGMDLNKTFLSSPPKTPDIVYIPMLSNIFRYGPWFAVGAIGKTDFEVDDSLTPWTYYGFAGMNVAGSNKVQDGIVRKMMVETGSIEIPGVPGVQLGDALAYGGPYVTNISVSVGDSITTTYDMSIWTPRPYKLSKHFANLRLWTIKNMQSLKRNLLKQMVSDNRHQSLGSFLTKLHRHIRRRMSSSHDVITAQAYKVSSSGSNEYGYLSVSVQPYYNAFDQIQDGYEQKAIMSLDGVFRPYSYNPADSVMSHVDGILRCVSSGEYFSADGEPCYHEWKNDGSVTHIPFIDNGVILDCVTVERYPECFSCPSGTYPVVNYRQPHFLYPISEYSNIQVFTHGTGEVPYSLISSHYSDQSNIDWKYIRGIGLSLPIVGVGWGLDVAGFPVPGATGDYTLLANDGRRRPDLWKVGPIDFRWDENKQVWTCGYGTQAVVAMRPYELPSGLADEGDVGGYFWMQVIQSDTLRSSDVVYLDESGYITRFRTNDVYIQARNIRNNAVLKGTKYFVFLIGGEWFIENQAGFV